MKYLFRVSLFFIFIAIIYATCFHKVTETKIYRRVASTNCVAQSNGNCYWWTPNYYETSETSERCLSDCSSFCNNWNKTRNETPKADCLERKVCNHRKNEGLNISKLL